MIRTNHTHPSLWFKRVANFTAPRVNDEVEQRSEKNLVTGVIQLLRPFPPSCMKTYDSQLDEGESAGKISATLHSASKIGPHTLLKLVITSLGTPLTVIAEDMAFWLFPIPPSESEKIGIRRNLCRGIYFCQLESSKEKSAAGRHFASRKRLPEL